MLDAMSESPAYTPPARYRDGLVDDPVLHNSWMVVARSEDVAERPVQVHLLGEAVVLFRNSQGLHAFRDLCIHRGSALSLGRVEDDTLVCAYHGWRYASNGQCVKIPAQPAGMTIPSKARAMRYHCREVYGLIWLCLGEPRADIPDYPEYHDSSFHTIHCGPYRVMAEAPRVVENFLDVSHLMWVHEGLLGESSHAEIPEHRVHRQGERLVTDPIVIYQPNPDGRGQGSSSHYVYEVLQPLSARFSKRNPGSPDVFSMMMHTTPTRLGESVAYILLSRNYGFELDDQSFRDFQDTVFAQDEAIVRSQRPEELPLDLAEELHLKSDRLAIAYRRYLAEQGVRVGVV